MKDTIVEAGRAADEDPDEDDAEEGVYAYANGDTLRGRRGPFRRGALATKYNVNHLATFKYAPATDEADGDKADEEDFIEFGMDRLLEIDRYVRPEWRKRKRKLEAAEAAKKSPLQDTLRPIMRPIVRAALIANVENGDRMLFFVLSFPFLTSFGETSYYSFYYHFWPHSHKK